MAAFSARVSLAVMRPHTRLPLRAPAAHLRGRPVYHSTFSPTLANASEWRAALATMAKWRLNVARVFVDTGAYGRSDGVASGGGVGQAPALSESYLDLLAQFVADAANAGVYTMVTLSGLPVDHAWGGAAPPQQAIVYPNAQYMDAAHVQAKALYAQLLVDGLQQRLGQAGMSALFGLSLENEAAFVGDVAPFSWTSGVVTTADGTHSGASPLLTTHAC